MDQRKCLELTQWSPILVPASQKQDSGRGGKMLLGKSIGIHCNHLRDFFFLLQLWGNHNLRISEGKKDKRNTIR